MTYTGLRRTLSNSRPNWMPKLLTRANTQNTGY